ncbi:MAG TPA: response regulator, partial [Puia sp.]|nr:response regulator [Puia sp.]
MNDSPKQSILLVEDEENLHDALKLNLELENYEVTSAYDGNEALKAIDKEYFDLVILDVMLPDSNGFAVCAHFRQRSKTPIIMLTALSNKSDKLKGLELGADDYITK